MDAQNALHAADKAIHLFVEPILDIVPHSGNTVFQPLDDVSTDAAPVVVSDCVGNGSDNARDGCNQFRNCPDNAGNQRYNDLRRCKDDLVKVVHDAIDKRDNQSRDSRHKLRDALDNSVNQRKQKVNARLNDARKLYNNRCKPIPDNQWDCSY